MWTLWHKNEENYNLRVFNEEPSEPRGWSRLNRLAKTTADASGHQEELQSLTAGAAVGRSCSRLREKDGLKVGTDANVHYCYELTVAKFHFLRLIFKLTKRFSFSHKSCFTNEC